MTVVIADIIRAEARTARARVRGWRRDVHFDAALDFLTVERELVSGL